MIMGNIVFHPKTKRLSATITPQSDSKTGRSWLKVDTHHQYMYDYAQTMAEAVEVAKRLLDEIYDGSYHKEMNQSKAYSRQEQIACGNW